MGTFNTYINIGGVLKEYTNVSQQIKCVHCSMNKQYVGVQKMVKVLLVIFSGQNYVGIMFQEARPSLFYEQR